MVDQESRRTSAAQSCQRSLETWTQNRRLSEWRKTLLVFQRQTASDEPRALTKLGKVLKSVRWCHPWGWSCLCGTRSSPRCPASALTHWFQGTRLTFWLARSSLVGQGGGSCEGGLGSEWTDTSEHWNIGWQHLAPWGTFDSMWLCLLSILFLRISLQPQLYRHNISCAVRWDRTALFIYSAKEEILNPQAF